MLLLSCFTTCSGSTGGGVKLIRAIIMLKQARREILRTVHPHNYSYQNWKSNCCKSSYPRCSSFYVLLSTYLSNSISSPYLYRFIGWSIYISCLACLNNLGPALFELGPSAPWNLSDLQLSILSVVMLLED